MLDGDGMPNDRCQLTWGKHARRQFWALDLPGRVAAGSTREEVTTLFHEAIEFHIEGMNENGLPIPAPSSSPELVEIDA